jgi:hypothetical protein
MFQAEVLEQIKYVLLYLVHFSVSLNVFRIIKQIECYMCILEVVYSIISSNLLNMH